MIEHAGALSREKISKLQRARILDAMVEVVGERGFAGASVGLVVAHAKVSRRTFYEIFNDLEDCLLVVMDEASERVGAVMAQAFAGKENWRDGVRSALATLLVLFDAEPLHARVWQLEVLSAGSWALEHREHKFAELRKLIVERWAGTPESEALMVAVEGVMAAVIGLIQGRLIVGGEEPLLELLGPLMGLAVASFVGAEARELEIVRGQDLARAILEGRSPQPNYLLSKDLQIPEVLLAASAHRARQCVCYLADHPGASNHQVGTGIGIVHQSQTSKLLARLASMGLLTKCTGTPGSPNAWSLTPEGEQLAQALEDY